MKKQIAFIDVETTGLSPDSNEIIELGMMLGEYEGNRMINVIDQYAAFQEPRFMIPDRITDLTGITNAMVYGKRLDLDRIYYLLRQADGIIAHNASFDRGFVSKILPASVEFDWYCSVRQIRWKQLGFENGKLQQLLYTHQINVSNAHRALDDSINLARLLNHSHPALGIDQTYLSYLLTKHPLKKPTNRRR